MSPSRPQTILFADVSGSTRLFETKGDVEARRLISLVLDALSDICRQHAGAAIDWLVEAPFAAIPQLHPGVQRVWPMISLWGKTLTVAGDKPGAAQVLKLTNNILSAVALAATSEAFVMGAKGGLDPEVMLAAINAVTAELSSLKGRSIAMSLMVIGYPIGATVGGIIAGMLLKSGDWRLVFEFGAIATVAFIPLVWFLVPETPDYYLTRRPADALARINKSLATLRLPAVDSLPPVAPQVEKPSVFDILKPGLLRTTMLLTIGYSFHAITFYYILKWSPKIVADFGYSQPEAASVLVWASIGGAMGALTLGLLTLKARVTALTIAAMLLSMLASPWLIGRADWIALRVSQQEWLQRAANDSIAYQREAWQQSSDEALAAVKAAGVKVIYPDKQPFRDAVAPFHQSLQQTDIGPLLQQIAEVGAQMEQSHD